jgi:hypothetical protein
MSAEWNATTISFCGIEVGPPHIPRELPTPDYGLRVKKTYMSEGAELPGLCVKEPLGGHDSYGTIAFRLSAMSKANVDTFLTAAFDLWTPRTLAISAPGGIVSWTVCFGENGFTHRLIPGRGYFDTEAWICGFKLEVLTIGPEGS